MTMAEGDNVQHLVDDDMYSREKFRQQLLTTQLPSASLHNEKCNKHISSDLEQYPTEPLQSSDWVTNDSKESIIFEHQSSEGESEVSIKSLSKGQEPYVTTEKTCSLKSAEVLTAISQREKDILSSIDLCKKRKEAILVAEAAIRKQLDKKVSEIKRQLDSCNMDLLKQLDSRTNDKLWQIDNFMKNVEVYPAQLAGLKETLLGQESLDENHRKLEISDFHKSLFEKIDVCIRQPMPSFNMVFREKETTDNILGKLEEHAETRSSEAAIRSATPKKQTLDGYKILLIDIYRKIAGTGNEHSFLETEITKLHSSDYLQNVQRELHLSDASERFERIQTKHTRMASLLFELTNPDTDQLRSHLAELQSCIIELWNMIQIDFHRRNSERGLLPKGFQNHGNTCYFNSVLQCLLQTLLLSIELTLNFEIFLKEFTLSEAYTILASTYYNNSEQRREALNTLYFMFTSATHRFNDQGQHDSHDLLIHFLDKLRVEERNAWGIPSVDPGAHKMLTAVDRIFGGQFITVYTCHSCKEPYVIREPFLDISIPLCNLSVDEKKPPETSLVNKLTNWLNTSGTPDARSQQIPLKEVENYAEDQSTYGSNHCPSPTVDCRSDTDSNRNVVKTMLETIATLEDSAESEARTTALSSSFLDFRNKTPNSNVSQCLKYFTRAEVIKDEYLCRNCQTSESDELTMTSATKRTLISSPPAILVLHLKRFEQTRRGFVKRDEMISYEEFLDLGPFCSSISLRIDPEEENVWYSLYAVVVHTGFFLSQGHYIAYVKQRDSSGQIDDRLREQFLQKNSRERDKVPNDDDLEAMEKRKSVKKREKANRPHPIPGQWFHISDDYVRSCDAKEALHQKAFLLFYERIPVTGHKSTEV